MGDLRRRHCKKRLCPNDPLAPICVHACMRSLTLCFLPNCQVNNGSVELYLDASGEFFSNTPVLVEKGMHDSQLCYKYSDGYEEVYPLKPFEVEQENDVIVLTPDLQKRGMLHCVCVLWLTVTELH